MGLFNDILNKLGFGKKSPQTPTPSSNVTFAPDETPAPASPAEPAAPAMETVDVVAKLEAMAADHPEALNWKTSIVDLLKLLGLDSSLSARKELATELGCPADKMADSAQMNMWLHKTVLQKLADNGGKVPDELL
ncbi:DUF3597 domain-containing protein [Photobacterium sp. WH77]|uniref:DUF3597 domain-containing protein n=1 Tax=unclassified Photobacterium TaxID=2628852 RepID=UPI001EDA1977|nr:MULTISPECIES: DUF3597 domain-containing protein [unclassified Photobacterium]MCG2838928.1 DUF3597 domain-containing protein [Photobacterium sp. WH77]MCG2846545.1 DUF3597 domain-containing protein [Photobacterium sp. WH80]MDO6583202.1 DUF3597 domain-containing protein [Photobacterium sp. 2_MG-2023]